MNLLKLLENFFSKLDQNSSKEGVLKKGAFSRERILTLRTILLSFLIDAHGQFKMGTKRLLLHLWLNDCLPGTKNGPPSEQAYRKACLKIPVKLIEDMLKESHQEARSDKDCLYEGRRVMIVDGSKFIIPRNDETIEKYGLGSGTSEAYYPQIHAGAILDLATGTFADVNINHGAPAERQMLLEHACLNSEPTLYITDAGYNGMAFFSQLIDTKHDLLMELKMGNIVKEFLKSKNRSQIIEVKLNNAHLKSYPECSSMLGKVIIIRLIRTRGTSKLRSRALITTLLDEKRYKWEDLAKMYLQRWKIELAFRHIKGNIQAEHIQKHRLIRIQQLLLSSFILFNLAAIIRNVIKCQSIIPLKKGDKIICFAFVLDLVDSFLIAALFKKRGYVTQVKKMLKAIRCCSFIYSPWRTRPKICQFPPSVFTRCKSTEKLTEFAKCRAIKADMMLLGMEYGQIEKNA